MLVSFVDIITHEEKESGGGVNRCESSETGKQLELGIKQKEVYKMTHYFF